jgi:hypothetical protein
MGRFELDGGLFFLKGGVLVYYIGTQLRCWETRGKEARIKQKSSKQASKLSNSSLLMDLLSLCHDFPPHSNRSDPMACRSPRRTSIQTSIFMWTGSAVSKPDLGNLCSCLRTRNSSSTSWKHDRWLMWWHFLSITHYINPNPDSIRWRIIIWEWWGTVGDAYSFLPQYYISFQKHLYRLCLHL